MLSSHFVFGRPTHSIVLVVFLTVLLYFLFALRPHVSIASNPNLSHSPQERWSFNGTVDADTHTFTHEQCSSAFPDLYYSIDQAVRRRRGRPVQYEDIAINQKRCMLRALIYEHEVRGFSFRLKQHPRYLELTSPEHSWRLALHLSLIHI